MRRTRWAWVLDCILIFLFCAFLIRPWWKLKYHENWGSIESTFIADARMLKDHWPRPLWQPFWYTGTRFDYVYPPALRYGTAALAKYYPMDAAKAYHLYTGFFYCFGIVSVYLLARIGFRRRVAALSCAFLSAFVSPSYPLFPKVLEDGFRLGTPKLNALVRYGEGPHMTALAWIPLALALAWLALDRQRWSWAVGSGVACAMVVANNFYGATALAMLYPLLFWSFWLRDRDIWRLRFAVLPPIVAYGLSAFWLTPDYFEITLRNMQYVSQTGNAWSKWVALAVIVAFLSLTNRWDRKKKLDPWTVFIGGAALIFTVNSVGNEWLGFRMLGEPGRLIPEVDILYTFVLAGIGIWLWENKSWQGKAAVGIFAIAVLAIHYNYLRHHRAIFAPPTEPKAALYYKIPDWIHHNYPEGRSFVTGAVRFWFNTWHDLLQLGGSSEQGLENQTVMPAQWEVAMGEDPKVATAWLQIMGVDVVATHGQKSKEWYHDFSYPNKFEGVLKKVYDDGEDNRIYEVPRRYRSLARVVDRRALNDLKQPPAQSDGEALEKFLAVYEQGPEAPTKTRWEGTDALAVEAKVGEGQTLIVQETYDAQWRVDSNKGSLSAQADQLGFIRIDAPAGVEWVKLRFEKPLAKTLGEILFVLTSIFSIVLVWMECRRKAD